MPQKRPLCFLPSSSLRYLLNPGIKDLECFSEISLNCSDADVIEPGADRFTGPAFFNLEAHNLSHAHPHMIDAFDELRPRYGDDMPAMCRYLSHDGTLSAWHKAEKIPKVGL